MRPLGIMLLCACLALPLLGCGSSGSPSSATGRSSSSTKPPSGGLKVITTPKFAPPGKTPVRSGQVEVAYRNITIRPNTLRVKVGTTVRWRNLDSVLHNVTSMGGVGTPQSFASQNFGEGKSYAVTLTRPGIIHYECTIHPATMNGTIEVLR
jgi:plastocyanin